jgi:hypothetical protein
MMPFITYETLCNQWTFYYLISLKKTPLRILHVWHLVNYYWLQNSLISTPWAVYFWGTRFSMPWRTSCSMSWSTSCSLQLLQLIFSPFTASNKQPPSPLKFYSVVPKPLDVLSWLTAVANLWWSAEPTPAVHGLGSMCNWLQRNTQIYHSKW